MSQVGDNFQEETKYFREPTITDMEYKDRKLTFKRKSKFKDREWK